MLQDVQKHLEAEALMMGFKRKVELSTNTYQRVEEGTSDVSSLPRGQKFLLDTCADLEVWFAEVVDAELKKRRKSSFFNHIVQPAMTVFMADDVKAADSKFYERRYENPLKLVPYFLAKYLTRLMVLGETPATEVARDVANSIHRAYADYKAASEEEMVGTVQLLRTFVSSPHNKAFEEGRYGTAITLKLSEKYAGLDLPLEEMLDGLKGEYAVFKPMVCEPIKHHNLLDPEGGYLTISSPLLKHPEFALIRQARFQDNEFIENINRLQSTKWQINTPLLKWMEDCTFEGVSKYFGTNSLALRAAQAKENIKMSRRKRVLTEEVFKCKAKMKDEMPYLKKEELSRIITNNMEEIERLGLQREEQMSYIGKVSGWEQTLRDAEVYGEYECFYHPVFCDNRGRIYTYNTTLSFQGNSLAKSLVQTHNKARMTPEALESVYELLGGMVDGMSKEKREKRVAFIVERLESIYAAMEHSDYSFLSLLDEDELLSAISLMFAIYHHHHDAEYETGVLAYIDSTSSAIQVQALVQRCEKAAYLTNLLPNNGDKLPDAYQEVANVCKEMAEKIAVEDDAQLKAVLQQYLSTASPDDLVYTEAL